MKRTTLLLAATLLTALSLFAEDNTPPPLAPAEKDADRLELMPSKPAQLLPPPTGLSPGRGGTQTAGGAAGSGGTEGSALLGGSAPN